MSGNLVNWNKKKKKKKDFGDAAYNIMYWGARTFSHCVCRTPRNPRKDTKMHEIKRRRLNQDVVAWEKLSGKCGQLKFLKWSNTLERLQDAAFSNYYYVLGCFQPLCLRLAKSYVAVWRMQDFLKGGFHYNNIIACKNFRNHAHFWLKPRPFSLIYLSVDLFLIENSTKPC